VRRGRREGDDRPLLRNVGALRVAANLSVIVPHRLVLGLLRPVAQIPAPLHRCGAGGEIPDTRPDRNRRLNGWQPKRRGL
jgi:hypothetical protein